MKFLKILTFCGFLFSIGSSVLADGLSSSNVTPSNQDARKATGWTKKGSNVYTTVSSDNVGIGTTAPTNPLEINSATESQIKLLKTQTGDTAFSVLAWDNDVYLSAGAYYDAGAWLHKSSTTYNQLLNFHPGTGMRWYAGDDATTTWNVASGVTLWNDSGYWKNLVQSTATGASYFTGGNVGIGTTAPSAPLEVYGASAGYALRVSGSSINYLDADGLRIAGSDTGNTIYQASGALGITTGGGNLSLGTTAGTAHLTISSGSVGIGTTVPVAKLDVVGAIQFSTTLTGSSTTNIGWTKATAANQACNTTCTTACVFGQNTADFSIVDCGDTTADACICAG